MNNTNYFLIGMPSSGKSTVGKLLALQMGLIFIDLDEVIVEAEGMPITDIFMQKGEAYFRETEKKNLADQINKNSEFVMATGGGTPCFFDNMDLMKKNGVTIYLDVNPKELHNKLSKKGTHKRPLLKDVSSDKLYIELSQKLEDRRVYYEQAEICLVQNFNKIADRVNSVIDAIKELEEESDREGNI
jgi:shikimate kinase